MTPDLPVVTADDDSTVHFTTAVIFPDEDRARVNVLAVVDFPSDENRAPQYMTLAMLNAERAHVAGGAGTPFIQGLLCLRLAMKAAQRDYPNCKVVSEPLPQRGGGNDSPRYGHLRPV